MLVWPQQFRLDVPRVWDGAAMERLELPLASIDRCC